MKCDDIKIYISAYFDNEIDLKTAVEIERHIESCETCRARLQIYRELSGKMKTIVPFRHEGKPSIPQAPKKSDGPRWSSFLTGAASAVAACMALYVGSHFFTNVRPSELTELHIRSLQANHLVDVASSEKHTIKPWFSGKIDFSYEPKDFPSDGYTLIGGRLERFAGKPAMALVYQFHNHNINLVISPQLGSDPSCGSGANFNTVCWQRGPLSFFIISDAEKGALIRLKDLLSQGE